MLFRVQYSLSYGDTLLLAGSNSQLGVWNPAAALRCTWSQNDVWSVHIPASPHRAPSRFEFKFCIRTATKAYIWEPGENHAVVISRNVPSDTLLDITWGHGCELSILTLSKGHTSDIVASSPPPTPLQDSAAHAVLEPLSIAVARVAAGVGSGSAESCPLVDVVFRLKYCLQKGERAYVLGSIPEIGAWNKMNSPRLEAVGDNFYEAKMQLPIDARHEQFEYKYFTRRSDGSRRWESGDNRVAKPFHTKGGTVFDDRWEKIRFEFSIYYPAKETEIMHITGDMKEIGAWFKPGPIAMELGPMQVLETDVMGRKWKLHVWTDVDQGPISYRYILIDNVSKQELWEREPNRRCEFEIGEPVVNGVRICRDLNFVSEMHFDVVPPNMFIGPYPQTTADVDAMAKAGVTGVFNVQTDEDFKHRGIQWDLLTKRYDKHGIRVVRFPIRDFDRDSLRENLRVATHALEDLIDEGRKVYIHCTAGMGRAPACAVSYLCWVKKMDLEEAVAFVKKHRKVAVPNVPVLEIALKDPY